MHTHSPLVRVHARCGIVGTRVGRVQRAGADTDRGGRRVPVRVACGAARCRATLRAVTGFDTVGAVWISLPTTSRLDLVNRGRPVVDSCAGVAARDVLVAHAGSALVRL